MNSEKLEIETIPFASIDTKQDKKDIIKHILMTTPDLIFRKSKTIFYLFNDKNCIIIRNKDGRIISALIYSWHPRSKKIVIYSLSALKKYRQKGLSKQLIERLQKSHPEAKVALFNLKSKSKNKWLQKYYERYGTKFPVPETKTLKERIFGKYVTGEIKKPK